MSDKRLISLETIEQLCEYTNSVRSYLGIPKSLSYINYTKRFEPKKVIGAVMHYTASNANITQKNPLGRIPVLLKRFVHGSPEKVGVHFIVMDYKCNELNNLRDKYPLIKNMDVECFCNGIDFAYWHAGWVNKFCYGIELRNLGRLVKNNSGFVYGLGAKYIGRQPVMVGRSWWEPFTNDQVKSCVWINRLMSEVYPISPSGFLGHFHISDTRWDPGKHFPLDQVRNLSLINKELDLNTVVFPNVNRTHLTNDDDDQDIEASIVTYDERMDVPGTLDYIEKSSESFSKLSLATQKEIFNNISNLNLYTGGLTVETCDPSNMDRAMYFLSGRRSNKKIMNGRGYSDENIKMLLLLSKQWSNL